MLISLEPSRQCAPWTNSKSEDALIYCVCGFEFCQNHYESMPRIFKLQRSAYLSLTRKNVARTEQLSYAESEWKPQKYYIADELTAKKNYDLLTEFKDKHNLEIETKEFNPIQKHAYLRCIKYEKLYSELLSRIQTHDNEPLNQHFFSALNEAIIKLELNPDVDLAILL